MYLLVDVCMSVSLVDDYMVISFPDYLTQRENSQKAIDQTIFPLCAEKYETNHTVADMFGDC